MTRAEYKREAVEAITQSQLACTPHEWRNVEGWDVFIEALELVLDTSKIIKMRAEN